jgi:hypothetical protein
MLVTHRATGRLDARPMHVARGWTATATCDSCRGSRRRSRRCAARGGGPGPEGRSAGEIKGSTQIWVERRFHLEDEVVVIPEAVRLPLDEFDLVVHAFELTGMERELAMGDNPGFMPS